MTQDTQILAERAAKNLLRIGGVFACAVRSHAEGNILEEIAPTIANETEPAKVAAATTQAAKRFVDDAPPPFPHVIDGNGALAPYMRGFTDLLALGDDERIDARVGQTRFVAESWRKLIVVVAIPMGDPATKSLARAIRRVRDQVEGNGTAKK